MTKNPPNPAAAAALAAYAAGDRRFITIVSTETPCGKVAALKADGTIEFTAAISNGATDEAGERISAVRGKAQTLHVPTAASLLAVLRGLQVNQYIIPDFVPQTIGAQGFDLVEGWEHVRRFGKDMLPTLDATSNCWVVAMVSNGTWSFGAWRVLDRDVDKHVPQEFRLPYKEWLRLVDAKLLPGVLNAPKVFWPSSKTRVRVKGSTAPESLNGHTWVDCSGDDGFTRTNEMRGRIRVQSVLAGVGWGVPKRSRQTGEPLPGKPMDKTLFDVAVWTIHRQLYAGPPVLANSGLEPVTAVGGCVEGTPLALESVLPLMQQGDRLKRYSAMAGAQATVTRERLNGTRMEVHLSVIDRKAMKLDTAVEVRTAAGSVTTTVQGFLRSDDFNFDEKYRCQCLFRESTSWNGIIRKYTNGQVMHHDNATGITYWLGTPDWQWVCDRFVAARQAGDADALSTFESAVGSFSDALWETMRVQIASRAGVNVKTLDAVRKAKKAKRTSASVDAMFEAASSAKRKTPTDLALLKTGDEIAQELASNWLMLLSTKSADAATFALRPASAGHGTMLEFKSFAPNGVKTFTAPFPIEVVDPVTGDVTKVSPVEAWMNSPKRDGATRMTFQPGWPDRIDGALNLWTGWPLKPIDAPEKCARFIQHVQEIIAAGDPEIAEYVLSWLAVRVQGIAKRKPRAPLPRMIVTLVMRSAQGTGKGLFEHYVAAMFGTHALVTVRGSGLVGRFNSEFGHLVMLCADEAFFAGDGRGADILKSFLTEPEFTFEAKFRDAVSLPNHCAVVMSTNSEWAVPAEKGDRRYCVIDIAEHRIGDKPYFDALGAEKDGDGPAALFGYLLNRDISQFDIAKYPKTQALREQQIRTISRDDPTIEWLEECLTTGEIELIVVGPDGRPRPVVLQWSDLEPAKLPRREAGEAIRKLAQSTRKYSPPSNTAVGMSMAQVFGHQKQAKATRLSVGIGIEPPKGTPLGSFNAPSSSHEPPKDFYEDFNNERINVWVLPRLSEARFGFEHLVRTGTSLWKGQK